MIEIQPCEREHVCVDGALLKFVQRLQRDRFFGIAELHFQDGEIVRVKRQEVVLPKDLLRLAAEE